MFICSAYLHSASQGAWTFTNMMSLFVNEGCQSERAKGFLKELRTKLKGVPPQLLLPPSPASDPRPVNSSQRCTSSPPVGWTSYKPEYSQYAFSHRGKKAQRSRLESSPEVRKHRSWERLMLEAPHGLGRHTWSDTWTESARASNLARLVGFCGGMDSSALGSHEVTSGSSMR